MWSPVPASDLDPPERPDDIQTLFTELAYGEGRLDLAAARHLSGFASFGGAESRFNAGARRRCVRCRADPGATERTGPEKVDSQ